MSQWVQSKYSKDANKWEVVEDMSDKYQYQWVVRSGAVPCGYHFLPKSEYIPCDPPERWETCTREVVVVSESAKVLNLPDPSVNVGRWDYMGNVSESYRWVWSEKDPAALIIQRRVQS